MKTYAYFLLVLVSAFAISCSRSTNIATYPGIKLTVAHINPCTTQDGLLLDVTIFNGGQQGIALDITEDMFSLNAVTDSAGKVAEVDYNVAHRKSLYDRNFYTLKPGDTVTVRINNPNIFFWKLKQSSQYKANLGFAQIFKIKKLPKDYRRLRGNIMSESFRFNTCDSVFNVLDFYKQKKAEE